MKRAFSLILTLCMIVSTIVLIPKDDLFVEADAALSVSGGTLNSATFILDPGHGGSDPGACLGSRAEANDVLRLSLRVAQLINANGSSAALTRVTDATQSLATKTSIANSGSFTYFVSVHRNAGGGVGIESYYYSGLSSTSTGAKLCTAIHNSMVNSGVWTKNRGVKTASYYVIKNTNMAATLLEVGFIDSTVDNSIFDTHFETIAVSIANGMLSMIGKSVSNTGSSSTKYQSCLDNPSGASVTNKATSASLSVTQKGSGDTFALRGWTVHSEGISSVRYKIDSGSYTNLTCSLRTDVQNAITGYSDYANCGFDGTINYGKLSGGSHTITIQAVTKKSNTYTVGTISLTVSDPISPTISNVTISNVTTSGYRVSCTVTDNAGIDRVEFPTWSAGSGQDDLIWHRGTVSGNTAYYDVKISEHGNAQDVYATHIYAYDISGNSASTASAGANLSSDSTAPTIKSYVIENVNYWGFDVKCTVSDNIGVTKVQFPTWSEKGGQDDIKWYAPTLSGTTATLHVNTWDHNNETGAYNVHLYAWDLWNNETCVEMSVTVPAPAYPTDSDYIPLSAINGAQTATTAQVWTTGTFTDTNAGVIVLQSATDGYTVKAKYAAGTARSVTASASSPIIAVPASLTDAYAAFEGVQIGDTVSLDGINLTKGIVLAKAHLDIPYTFVLVDSSDYSLDENYVTITNVGTTAAAVADEFKCSVKVYDMNGAELSDTTVSGTGCVVKYINSAGTVINSATIVLAGDLNGDGAHATVDLIIAETVMMGTATLKGAFDVASDLNGDEILSVSDIIIMEDAIRK